MAKHEDRKKKKQAQRDAELCARALRRGQVLEVIALGPDVVASVDRLVIAKMFAQELATARRQADSATLGRLVGAWETGAVELALLGEDEATACRWALLGPSLHGKRLDVAAQLAAALRPALSIHAPALVPWIDSAIANDGHVPATATAGLPRLPDVGEPQSLPAPAWLLGSDATAAELGDAVLAGSVLLPPRLFGEHIASHLSRIAVASRAAHAAAAMPAVTLRLREAAAAREAEATAACIGIVVALHGHHADPDALALALRSIHVLDLQASKGHRGSVEALIEAAWSEPQTHALAGVAFESLHPRGSNDGTQRCWAERLADRMLQRVPSPAIWAHAFSCWSESKDGSLCYEPPEFLESAYVAMVHSGALAAWLADTDDRRRGELVHELVALPWQAFVALVEQLWDRVGPLEHGWLAEMVTECLQLPEAPSTPTPRSGRPITVAALLERISRFLATLDEAPPEQLLMVVASLAAMPPGNHVPAQLVAAFEPLLEANEPRAYGGAHGKRFGPAQRGFIDRVGLRIVPYSPDLLHMVLHEPDVLRDGVRWVDAYLAGGATNDEMIAVADMIWDHGWRHLATHIEAQIDLRAGRSTEDLAALVRKLGTGRGRPAALVARLSARLLDAAAVAEHKPWRDASIDPVALAIARRRAPKPGRARSSGTASRGGGEGTRAAGSKPTTAKTRRATKTPAAAKPAAAKPAAAKPAAAKRVRAKVTTPAVAIAAATPASLPTACVDEPTARVDEPTARVDEPAARIDEPAARIDEPAARIDRPTASQLALRLAPETP